METNGVALTCVDTPNVEIKKRKISNTAKGRTGCITCKIRRIKCDEKKPHCNRCVSTGRKCDGYASAIRMVDMTKLSRKKKATPPLVTGMITPPPSLSIEGTDLERRHFFNYIRFTETTALHHTCNTHHVWARFIPQLGHHYDVVKHSMVAFGAAFQRFKLGSAGNGNGSPLADTIDQLESFTTQQYCTALTKLGQLPDQGWVDSAKMALACCLNFVCIESLRANHHTALWHLNNGVRIIETLEARNKDLVQGGSLYSSDPDLTGLIHQFYDYQICLQGLEPEAPSPLQNPRARPQPDDDPFPAPPVFKTVPEGHNARVRLASSTMDYKRDIETCEVDLPACEQAVFDKRLLNLCKQALLVDEAFETFLAGPDAPTSPALYLSYIDSIHVICISGTLELMAVSGYMHDSVVDSDPFQAHFIDRLVEYGEAIHAALSAPGPQRAEFGIETAIVGPLRWAYQNAMEPKLKDRALKILQETQGKS